MPTVAGRLPLDKEGLRKQGGALALLAALVVVLGTSPASACDWWRCGDGPYAYRPAPRTHGYRGSARSYRYRGPTWAYRYNGYNGAYNGAGWAYGYTSPARFYGYPYAPWPSTSIPPTRSYLNTATPVPNAGAVGLIVPITSAEGLLEGGLPAKGPSLFGPNPPPPALGYYYGNGYGGPAYGYGPGGSYAHRPYGTPPADSPSWWVEPRRRR